MTDLVKEDQVNASQQTDMTATILPAVIATLTLTGFFLFPTLLVGDKSNLPQASTMPQTTRLTTYVVPDEFSIQHPTGWFVERTVAQPDQIPRQIIVIQNLQPPKATSILMPPPNLIKTVIRIERDSFETVANQVISGIGMDGGTLTRKGRLSVGGREALRLWATNVYLGHEGIVTLVPYRNNETAFIASYYDKSNSTAIRVIQTMHWSFRVID